MSDAQKTTRALRDYKVRFILLVIFLVGLALTGVALYKEANEPDWPSFLDWIPFLALGETLISASIIGFVFEMFVRRENDRVVRGAFEESLADTKAELTRAMTSASEELKQSLTLSSLVSAAAIDRLSPDEKQKILKQVLISWTGDRAVAHEAERLLLPEFSRGREYWKDVRYDLQLAPDRDGHPDANRYISATVTCEYEAVLDRPAFVALMTQDDGPYDLIDTKRFDRDYVLNAGNTIAYKRSDPVHFDYESIEIDDMRLRLTRRVVQGTAAKPGYVEVTGKNDLLLDVIGKQVRHRIVARMKLPKRGHYFTFPLIRTAVGLECRVRADTTELKLRKLSMLPFLQGGGPVKPTESSGKGQSVYQVRTSRTVIAGSGVLVTWNLEGEYAEAFDF